jgi:hypothetical protein
MEVGGWRLEVGELGRGGRKGGEGLLDLEMVARAS